MVSGLLTPVSAVSRKTHRAAGDFDIALPLTGRPGIECRNDGTNTHKVVITFASPVTVNGGNQPQATVTPPATVSNVSVSGSVVTVDLANVPNAQTISLTLNAVSDAITTNNVVIPMSLLAGDVNDDTRVNVTDTNQTKANSGQLAKVNNFRTDVNVDGRVNVADTNAVKSRSGTSLP